MPRRKQEPQKLESEGVHIPSAKKSKEDIEAIKENFENGVNNANGDNGIGKSRVVSNLCI